MYMSEETVFFLNLVRLGIGNDLLSSVIPKEVNWTDIQTLAGEQGLSAIVLDGLERLRDSNANVLLPEKKHLTQWIGEVLQGFEYRYELYTRAIAEMALFYNSHGFKMMVLKGYACSVDWPKPEHRPCGDIDIWLFGRQKEADKVLAKERGIDVDESHHHHTVFFWRDFMVENHYDFINVHRHRSHKGLEEGFKELGKDDSHFVEVYGEKVYLPSPNLHALFLVRHALNHFASIGINLRQVLDWAFFVKTHADDIDWDWLLRMLEKYNMKDFFLCLNAICVEELGFDASVFHEITCNPTIKEKVFADIINSGQDSDTSHHFVNRMVYRFKRWKRNAWKHKLCYKESRWGTFWSGLCSFLIRPSMQ